MVVWYLFSFKKSSASNGLFYFKSYQAELSKATFILCQIDVAGARNTETVCLPLMLHLLRVYAVPKISASPHITFLIRKHSSSEMRLENPSSVHILPSKIPIFCSAVKNVKIHD